MDHPWVPVRKRVQSELIKRGHCVGCTRSLADGERQSFSQDTMHELVLCKCGRVFVYDKLVNNYRRATHKEWQNEATKSIT